MARQGRRVAVVGATGHVGGELVRVLEERDFPVASLLPIATDDSLGESVELVGADHPVETGEVPLRGVDVAFVCTPAEAAGRWVREALGAEVPCIDLSGAFAAHDEVPLVVAALAPPREQLMKPLVAGPSGPALTLALALAPLTAEAPLASIAVTAMESVGGAGREGVRALEAEVIALFSQGEAPESSVFPSPVAFDLVPELTGAGPPHGPLAPETGLAAALARLLGRELPLDATFVRVPSFTGLGLSVVLRGEGSLDPAAAREWLVKAPGVEVWDPDLSGPTTRDAAERSTVLVGGVRAAHGGGLQLWLASDPVRLAARNAVRIAEARFDLH